MVLSKMVFISNETSPVIIPEVERVDARLEVLENSISS